MGTSIGGKHPTLEEAMKQVSKKEKQVYFEVRRALQDAGFFQPREWIRMDRKPIAGKEGYWVHSQATQASKISYGHPDMFVCLAGSSMWLAVELKARKVGKRGDILKPRLSDEQKFLAASGCIVIIQGAWQVEELVADMRRRYDA